MNIETAVKQAIGEAEGWSDEDKAWLEKVPKALQPIALRHGRPLYSLVIHCGAVNHALGIIARQNNGNKAVAQAIRVIAGAVNQLAPANLPAGKLQKDFQDCHQDIERMIALMDTGKALPDGARVSKGGIILNS